MIRMKLYTWDSGKKVKKMPVVHKVPNLDSYFLCIFSVSFAVFVHFSHNLWCDKFYLQVTDHI